MSVLNENIVKKENRTTMYLTYLTGYRLGFYEQYDFSSA